MRILKAPLRAVPRRRQRIAARRARLILVAGLLALGALAGVPAEAQDHEPARSVQATIVGWGHILDSVEAYVSGLPYTPAQHAAFAAQLSSVSEEAKGVAAQAQGAVEANLRLLNTLGPAPAESEPGEAREIAQKRRELSEAIGAARAQIAQAELARARAAGLYDELSQVYRRSLLDQLGQRLRSPLTPSRLAPVFGEAASTIETMVGAPVAWLAGLPEDRWRDFWLNWRMILLAGAMVAGWLVRRALLGTLGRDTTIAAPSYARRLVAAIAESIADGMVPAAVVACVYFRVQADEGLAEALAGRVATAACTALIFFVLTAAFSRAVLAPDLPQWRLTSLAPAAARMLNRRIMLLAGVYTFDLLFSRATREMVLSSDLLALYAMVMGAIEAFGIVAIMQGVIWRLPAEAPTEAAEAGAPAAGAGRRHAWTALRWNVSAVALAGVVAAIAGYVRLGHYLVGNLLISGTIFALIYLCRGLFREVIGMGLRSQFLTRRCGLGARSGDLISFWLEALTGPLLIGVGVYAVMPSWGVPGEDIRRWTGDFLSGFTIGGVRLSAVDAAVAVAVFALALMVTRALRRTLSERVLPLTKLDLGIRNSLSVGVGYIGSMVAVLLAIAVLGIDLSNLAIVAGALSVGIGFGLQNIVNNFISGLILLVERPIKAGDWVVVGTHQGYVKRINVRATEIETFERASVLLPNSELLQSAVLNWTHKDKTGRVEVGVGVAYGSDTQKVRDILLECARGHVEISSWPAPYVVFREFGASSLDFEVRAFIKDIEKRLMVASDLRFAIDQAFRDNDIEIPFAQHDIRLRDLDRLEQVLAGARALAPAAGLVPLRGGIRGEAVLTAVDGEDPAAAQTPGSRSSAVR
ncbi:MAG: mechanosensitive ion channel family protein [Rhodospirillales bacterium]|nr:mechanosensitive ion channel family protein [Rhodospirillales bacterium]